MPLPPPHPQRKPGDRRQSPPPPTPVWHRITSAYRRWPRWARIGAPVAAVLLVALSAGANDRSSVSSPIIDTASAGANDRSSVSGPMIATDAATTISPTTVVVATTGTVVSTSTTRAATSSTSAPTPAAEVIATVLVTNVVDGDTLDVADGSRVRLIGIDTPEPGECGHQQATAQLGRLVLGKEVALVVGTRDDTDRYGRLLRYIDVDGLDANLEMILGGVAVARYDSRDGYGRHDREDIYVSADNATASTNLCPAPDTTTPSPQPAPAPADTGTDPRFKTCKEAKSRGYGPYVKGVHAEYSWYRDADKDGIVCE
jgi:endonuclease YncB( thermonuclease family)